MTVNEDKLLICGPCAAESREQLINIAQLLKSQNINCSFRAGIWKPRTTPGNFEGLGEIAIKWMCEVRDLYGFEIGWFANKKSQRSKRIDARRTGGKD